MKKALTKIVLVDAFFIIYTIFAAVIVIYKLKNRYETNI